MRFATALEAAEAYRDAAKAALVGRLLEQSIEADQRAAHGFAWVATSVAALGAVHYWLDSNGGGTQLDQQIASLIFTEQRIPFFMLLHLMPMAEFLNPFLVIKMLSSQMS